MCRIKAIILKTIYSIDIRKSFNSYQLMQY